MMYNNKKLNMAAIFSHHKAWCSVPRYDDIYVPDHSHFDELRFDKKPFEELYQSTKDHSASVLKRGADLPHKQVKRLANKSFLINS